MLKITLKLENLKSGDASFREFDNEEATLAFLRERPRFTDVLGVVFEGLTPEQNARLKGAMRPLDDEEKAAEEALEKKRAQAAELVAVERRKAEEAQRSAHREALKNADPNRPMEIRYLHGKDLSLVDHDDPREIPDEARAAVMAWVAEREEWVADRGQIVAEAKVTVWPGKLPKPTSDRVQGGTFIPVTAPAKPKTDGGAA
ncbi:MAG: hypothetical protein HUU21_14205 [Polyangiaceae bacterium]|nr:hypothetical protein [Polyangiaceae bacterium]